jgi:multiple sugar transport system substrate-binding protein
MPEENQSSPQLNPVSPTIPPVEVYSQVGSVPSFGAETSPPTTPPKPKKGFPKILLILFAVLILAAVAFFVIPKFLGEGGKGETTITWWGLWEDSSVVSPLIAEYEAQNPKVKIEYVKQSQQDYRERLTNALAKGTGPDIFRFHNSWVPMFKNELDFVPSSVMSASEYAQSFYPVASSDLTSGTGLVGVPLEYDGLVLYINEDIFSEEGKSIPTTWDNLRQTALELTIKDDQGVITRSGVALGRTENVDHWQEILALMMLQNGVDLTRPTGKLAEDALKFFTIFSSTDAVWDASLPPSTVAFAAGKAAMYFGPSWRAFEIRQQNPNLKFKTAPMPQLPKTSSSEPDMVYATYWAEGVWSRSQNKEEAWKFLKFISSKESLGKMYQNASKVRLFGEPYPRVDMADLLKDDPILGAVVAGAADAESWFLASRTFDGITGINSQIGKYFEDAVNSVNAGNPADKALETVAQGVSQVLSQYGLTTQ